MSTPDSTAAFDADVARDHDDVDALKARIAELEQRGKDSAVADGEVVEVIDPNDPAPSDTIAAAHVATVGGHEFRFHLPTSGALIAFGLGASNKRSGEMQMATMSMFFQFHLLAEDYTRLLELLLDPNEDFGDEEYGDLLNVIMDAASDSPEANAPKTGPRR
ncbi:hypothetical protein ACFORJ_01715 [Corynebacterium hansenii]|uniref:Tail assembly chaperone n=1 Tax=Corynebacterium hansenii TaxID=394964 RepID=A0ABV7ZLD4_9CORY|nr:hypothetical protein [Corynebacterium hansenii]WJY99283.1 hypothetical protein CHAN_03275 [Corynebacterium hansenii]